MRRSGAFEKLSDIRFTNGTFAFFLLRDGIAQPMVICQLG
jgi:hypothetical protein